MKKICLMLISFVVASQAVVSMAGVNVDINLGVPLPAPPPPRVIVAQPPPAYPGPPEVIYEEQPRFLFSPELGFYVSVGSPYDMVFVGSRYYLYSGGFWYAAPSYAGPWGIVRGRSIPPMLRRHPYEQIRRYRDSEYRVYLRDPGHYRGRMHEPEWRRREIRREEPRREEHRMDEHRREERRYENRDGGERR